MIARLVWRLSVLVLPRNLVLLVGGVKLSN